MPQTRNPARGRASGIPDQLGGRIEDHPKPSHAINQLTPALYAWAQRHAEHLAEQFIRDGDDGEALDFFLRHVSELAGRNPLREVAEAAFHARLAELRGGTP